MTDDDLFCQALDAITRAIRLWPARHPAEGMLMGVREENLAAYEAMQAIRTQIEARLMNPETAASSFERVDNG